MTGVLNPRTPTRKIVAAPAPPRPEQTLRVLVEADFVAVQSGTTCINQHCGRQIVAGQRAVRTIDGVYLHRGCALDSWQVGYVRVPSGGQP